MKLLYWYAILRIIKEKLVQHCYSLLEKRSIDHLTPDNLTNSMVIIQQSATVVLKYTYCKPQTEYVTYYKSPLRSLLMVTATRMLVAMVTLMASRSVVTRMHVVEVARSGTVGSSTVSVMLR